MRYQGQGKHEEVSPGIHGNRGEDFGLLQAEELGFGPGLRGLLWARELQWMSYIFPAQTSSSLFRRERETGSN